MSDPGARIAISASGIIHLVCFFKPRSLHSISGIALDASSYVLCLWSNATFNFILCISSHQMNLIQFIICFSLFASHLLHPSNASYAMHLIQYVSFNASHSIYFILNISFFAFCSVLIILTIVETRCRRTDRPSDRQMDIETYRAAKKVKNK